MHGPHVLHKNSYNNAQVFRSGLFCLYLNGYKGEHKTLHFIELSVDRTVSEKNIISNYLQTELYQRKISYRIIYRQNCIREKYYVELSIDRTVSEKNIMSNYL